MKEKRFSLPVVGGSALLTIFSVLCLVVFSLLSISTVQSQRRLSQASAEAVAAYYRADTRAEEILAELRQKSAAGSDVYRYTVPISDTQALEVAVCLDGEDYTILRWQAVSTVQWEEDETINVWSGD